MTIKNKIIFFYIFCTSLCFCQKGKDVYFLLKKDSENYLITADFSKNLQFITLFQRKEYEYHKKKVEEAKANGTYVYNPDSGRDNLKIKVPSLTFEVISVNKTKITDCEISKLRLVTYEWIQNNSWKKIAKQPTDFKDIYFMYQTNNNNYTFYKVGLTIVEY